MSEIKTIANCKPTEFLRQTAKIRRAVERWLKLTDIIGILKEVAPQTATTESMTDAEKTKITAQNAWARRENFKRKISKALDVIMEEHPDETIKILALCCFIEPEKADDYEVSYYLKALTTLISDDTVIDFFISLAKLGNKNISDVSEA